PSNPVVAINALSAACAAAAAGIAAGLCYRLDRRALVSAGVALTFAFSRAVWDTALITEVYALNLLLTVAALAAVLQARTKDPIYYYLAAFLVGLGAANHPFALLAGPPLAVAAFLPGDGAAGWRRVPAMLGAF